MIAVPLLTLAFGLHATPVLRRWGRLVTSPMGSIFTRFRFSGLLIHLFRNQIGFPTLLGLATLASFGLAWCSWRIVERPALILSRGGSEQPPRIPKSSRNNPRLRSFETKGSIGAEHTSDRKSG